ncbi:MAG: glycosyltransferase family 39 protein [Planctomycetota bacterium]|jgi:hypothetical protein|nr:glycosyltransferase family 39 protein [Planctomycetota bacterium]
MTAISDGDSPGWHRHAWVLAALAVALGFALRVGGVSAFWINGDEGIYYTVAHSSWDASLSSIGGNAHPPLFYWFLRALTAFSDDYIVLRIPALIAGCLSIYLLFVLTRRLAGPFAGVLAALMLALSPGAIMLSQVARPYMVHLALLITALIFLFRHLSTWRPRHAWYYSVAMMLAALVHYSSFQVIGGVGLALVVGLIARWWSPGQLRVLVLAHIPLVVIVALLFFTHILPNLMGGDLQAQAVNTWLKPYFLGGLSEVWTATLGISGYLAGPNWVATAMLTGLAAFATALWKRPLRPFAATCIAVLISAIFLSLLGLYPYGGHRHSIYLACLILPVTAAGLAGLMTIHRGAALGTLAALALFITTERSLAPLLEGTANPGWNDQRALWPELSVTADDLRKPWPELDKVQNTAGLLITDQQTACSLAPLLRQDRSDTVWAKDASAAYLTWGKRTLVISAAWTLEASRQALSDPHHLGRLIEKLPSILPGQDKGLWATDIRILTSQGPTLTNRLGGEPALSVGTGLLFDLNSLSGVGTLPGLPHKAFYCFRIDSTKFLAACKEAMGR